ncbi:hypothetical protein C8035_v005862 [Colletotrichum spinosum]|uniref:Uncharacterized protein n=1 Tax=Colletotrichum spinosum TaxID=1347390 RepID=A0A4R8PUL0_9PEZI|nr:hypothetical protein C8035_v005862 [Colletotrichum spinosum]
MGSWKSWNVQSKFMLDLESRGSPLTWNFCGKATAVKRGSTRDEMLSLPATKDVFAAARYESPRPPNAPLHLYRCNSSKLPSDNVPWRQHQSCRGLCSVGTEARNKVWLRVATITSGKEGNEKDKSLSALGGCSLSDLFAQSHDAIRAAMPLGSSANIPIRATSACCWPMLMAMGEGFWLM